jgi:hypothetical protein
MFILNAGSVNLSLRNRTNGWVSDWETKGFETKFDLGIFVAGMVQN